MRMSDWSSDVCSSDLASQEKGWFWGLVGEGSDEPFSRLREKVPEGRMRGASAASLPLISLWRRKNQSNSLRSRPHPALRATFSRCAGEGLPRRMQRGYQVSAAKIGRASGRERGGQYV